MYIYVSKIYVGMDIFERKKHDRVKERGTWSRGKGRGDSEVIFVMIFVIIG